MNTAILIKECYDVALNILNGVYPTIDNLNSCKDELKRLLDEDRIIQKHNMSLYNQIKNAAFLKIDTKNEDRKIASLKHFMSKIEYQINLLNSNFVEWLKIEIVESVIKDDYDSIDYLLNVLVSQCIYSGWSKQGLFKLQYRLYNNTGSDIDLIKNFLNDLFCNDKSFKVYINIHKPSNNLDEFKIWAKKFNVNTMDGSESKNDFLNLHANKFYLVINTSAKDSVTAALNATIRCKKFMELLTFYNKIEPWIPNDSTFYVLYDNNKVDKFKFDFIYGANLYIESSNKIFDSTLDIFSEVSKKYNIIQSELQNVYSYNNISKTAIYQEEKFLNMWISLESFMNTGYYNNIISHIKNVLPSVMCRRYIYRLIRNVCEDITRCSIDLNSVIKINITNDNKQQVVKDFILKLKDINAYKKVLKCTNVNTLLKYRLEKIYKLINDEKKLHDRIIRFSETVKWHIQRLYRIRNDITHTGYLKEKNITQYIEHIHNFIVILIIEVVYIATEPDYQFNQVSNILTYLNDIYVSYRDRHCDINEVYDTGIIDFN